MKLLFEVIIYCLVYTLLVKAAKGSSPLNCLYFYPEPVRKKAYALGLADEQGVHKRAKRFYTYFLAALVILLFVFMVIVNKTQDFGAAFSDLYLILVIGNWFDGIVIDRFWVSRKSWVIPETAGIPHLKPWKTVLVRRTLGTFAYIPIAAIFALIFSKLSICIWNG
ncbi:MAG: hypothetical protein LUD78_00395 [Clostridiales bacterium]|nr:hypothetical protein [Clostridiales bacterium]